MDEQSLVQRVPPPQSNQDLSRLMHRSELLGSALLFEKVTEQTSIVTPHPLVEEGNHEAKGNNGSRTNYYDYIFPDPIVDLRKPIVQFTRSDTTF